MISIRTFLLFALCAGSALADERILSFDQTVTVQGDGALEVHEAIRVRAEGQQIRRGILREFPTTYPASDGRQVVVGFRFEAASRDGQEEPWRTEQVANGVRVYLGNPNAMLSHGEHVYELVYRTDRQMGFFADHDELYWNVTGVGSNFPIDRATARVLLPANIPIDTVRLEAYTGPQGSKQQNFTATIDNGAPLFVTTRALGPHEGLTIVATWPKGYITAPVEESVPAAVGATSSPGYPVADGSNRTYYPSDMPRTKVPLFLAVGGFALLLFYYYRIWLKVGVDPPSRIIIPEYEMPGGQSPASMRFLMRRGYDDGCLASAVLSLAVKGHLRIEQESGLLGLGKTTTLVGEARADAKPLLADETELLRVLFSRGKTLELKQENRDRVHEAEIRHGRSLEDRYQSGFFNINGGWHFLGIVLSVVLGLAAGMGASTEVWPAWHFLVPAGWVTVFIVLLMLITNGVFGRLLQAPTIAGQKVMDHIRGFKMYLEVAEGEALKQVKAPPLTPELFENYLPAALALGVEQRWAERFKDVLSAAGADYSPAWYAGSAWNAHSVGAFTSGLSASLSTAISSSSTAPGSHSGSSGGGSSGGGGGGGGVGGW